MLHDFVGYIEIVSVFDKCPTGLASTGIATQGDIGLEIGNDALSTVVSLHVYSLEEEVHCLYKASARSTGCGGKHTLVEVLGHSI